MSIVMIPEVPAAKNTGVSFCKSAVKYAHYLQAAATKSTSQGIACLYVSWNTTWRYLQPRTHRKGVSVCVCRLKRHTEVPATKSTLQGSVSLYVGGTPPGGTCNHEHILFVGECQSSSCNLKHIKGDCLSVCQLEHHLEVHAIKNTL